MEFEKQDIITLSDNQEYVVVSKIIYNNEYYIYLVDIHDNNNLKFAKLQNTNSVFVLDSNKNEELIKKLIPLFYDESKNDIKTGE